MRIPLDPFAEGSSAPTFTLLTARGRGYIELAVADESGLPLAPRLRIENVNGLLRLLVWDATAQNSTGPHQPPYSHSIILAHAEPSADKRLFGLLPPAKAEVEEEDAATVAA